MMLHQELQEPSSNKNSVRLKQNTALYTDQRLVWRRASNGSLEEKKKAQQMADFLLKMLG